MSFSLSEWLNLALRWFHVFAGILWIGQTYYFTWLDAQLRKGEKSSDKSGGAPAVWMVHSGGFYTVEKQKELRVPTVQVHWFRWEAAFTWLSGFLLLILVYYFGGAMLDDNVSSIQLWGAIAVGIGTMLAGWAIYDLAVRTPLAKSSGLFASFAFIAIVGATFGLTRVISGRAAYIHIGAMFGTVMFLNVWMRILPAQRRLIAAASGGAPFDQSLADQAKLRSKHNTFLAIPVVFIMISNHFPVATYGSSYNWAILSALVLAGWGAAKIVRRA
ncbi:MAG TPA: urate hydroxylase PuuD [Candidatus Acidoferrales bacterium]|nr:urate hydroxylase PuuD [Candidatus Acidoferrales bacterium]